MIQFADGHDFDLLQMRDEKPIKPLRGRSEPLHRPLPEGFPFQGMTEKQAQAWAKQHTPYELADALGLTTGAVCEGLLSGSILSMQEV